MGKKINTAIKVPTEEYDLRSHFFFFFQAEDGIRDLTVTGVQTCALPIWIAAPPLLGAREVYVDVRDARQPTERGVDRPRELLQHLRLVGPRAHVQAHRRSEERRVGKECRSRWSPYH